MRLSTGLWCTVLISLLGAHAPGTAAAQEPARSSAEPEIDRPLTAAERFAAAELTRLRETRLWWNDVNRVTGASFKGADANDRTLALASALPGLRTVVIVATPQCRLTDDGLAPLAAHPALELLSISGNRITDGALTYVGQMSRLRTLVLNGNITDAGLEPLAALTDLELLDLTQSRITDAGVAHLAHFPRLTTLVLNGTRITSAAVPEIAQIKTLERLCLGDTAVDDAAIPTLAQMQQLQLLFLLNTHVTAKAVAELQQQLPRTCKIVHQSGTCQGAASQPLAMSTGPAQTQTPLTPTTWRPAR